MRWTVVDADASAVLSSTSRRPPSDQSGASTWGRWGRGLVTGASDDDRSGIATYSPAGAQFAFLWAALVTLPLMAGVQEICDRTALATGTGLGELAVKRFGRAGRGIVAVLLVALLVANALNIAADLVAMGSGMELLHAGPTWWWALVAGAVITVLLVLGTFSRASHRCAKSCAPRCCLTWSSQGSSSTTGRACSATRSSLM